MIVLGLDPGLAHLGWTVRSGSTVVDAGVFRTKAMPAKARKVAGVTKGQDKMRRADELARFLAETIRVYCPAIIAHESVSLGFGAKGKTHVPSLAAMDLGISFGAIATACASYGARRMEIAPRAVKGWAAAQLWREPIEAKVSKETVIAAVKAADPTIKWPKATLIWEHLADSYVVAVLAAARAEVEQSDPRAPLGSVRRG